MIVTATKLGQRLVDDGSHGVPRTRAILDGGFPHGKAAGLQIERTEP